MKSEIESMYENKVWTLTDLPDDRRAIENKWIFKKKTDADGNVTIYKARLVAKGYRQVEGIDYGRECLIVVNPLNLPITLSDKSSFIDGNITIRIRLLLKDPFVFYRSPIIGQVCQSPYFVFIHGFYLGSHGF